MRQVFPRRDRLPGSELKPGHLHPAVLELDRFLGEKGGPEPERHDDGKFHIAILPREVSDSQRVLRLREARLSR